MGFGPVQLRTRGFTSGLLVGFLLASLAQLGDGAKSKARYQSLVRMERYGNCPELPDSPNYFNFSEVVPYGKTWVARSTFILTRDYKTVTKTTARIWRCADRNDPHCELFATWRFGEETCKLLVMQNAIWTPIFTFQPKMSCPLKRGVYRQENVTVDIERLRMVRFPEDGYFKVSITMEAERIPKQGCFYVEVSFIKVKM